LGHARRGGYVSGREGRKARGVHVADLAVKGDRLAVAVNQEYGSRGAFDAQAGENTFNSLELVFLYNNGRFCHLVFSLEKADAGSCSCCEICWQCGWAGQGDIPQLRIYHNVATNFKMFFTVTTIFNCNKDL